MPSPPSSASLVVLSGAGHPWPREASDREPVLDRPRGLYRLTYVMLGWGLNIVVGLAGLLDLGYVAFYAVGAYTFALAVHQRAASTPSWPMHHVRRRTSGSRVEHSGSACRCAASWPPSGGSSSAFRCCGCAAIIWPSSPWLSARLSGWCLINWVDLTNGGAGIASIPAISFFGMPFSSGESAALPPRFGLTFDPMHRIIFLYFVILALCRPSPRWSPRCGCVACRWGGPGKPCGKTRSPAARWASTPR